ncbi:unnamed protein product (macronuclear) [Paramecium tetraurelia]|uniref:Uncharacterized protein n=1 Tax=Paramecium tetraurelia TaxID=5888 RepID=A0BGR2_PARTE|nr:uncharacterized protein GSPATT00028764001 [Paramecium tetraurelia]CAK57729.1 unnamed protein product [Paramecium tetraurelia]|eukprot:XP_001425127.1 hypothetical protein (macronuclear) [Paramecium tetraurelia strain d4-2]
MKCFLALLFVVIAQAGNCGQTCYQDLPTKPPMTFYKFISTGRFFGGNGDSSNSTFGYSGTGKKCSHSLMKKELRTCSCKYLSNKKMLKYNAQSSSGRACSFQINSKDKDKMCGRTEVVIHGCAGCTPSDWNGMYHLLMAVLPTG